MKLSVLIFSLFIGLNLYSQSIDFTPPENSLTIKIDSFTTNDIEEILGKYEWGMLGTSTSYDYIQDLCGIALLNEFEQVSPKFALELIVLNDTIIDSACFLGETLYWINPTPRFRSLCKHSVDINYLSFNNIYKLEFRRYSSEEMLEGISFKNNTLVKTNYQEQANIQTTYMLDKQLIETGYFVYLEEENIKRDTLVYFSPYTYEEWIRVTANVEKTKIGVWTITDENGNIISATAY